MFKHILVPLDGSPLAESALPAALELAARFDGEITLVQVTRPPYLASNVAGVAYGELITDIRRHIEDTARDYLLAHKGTLRQQGYRVHTHVIEGEPVADVLLGLVDSLGVDIVVMSTHGRGGVSRWVFGSVADKILRRATVPVLLTRAMARDEREQPSTTAVAI